MPTYISKKFLDKLDQVEKQECWTVKELSEILEIPTRTINGKIKRKEFSIAVDIHSRKVISESVVEFYMDRFKKLKAKMNEKALERVNKAAIELHRELDKLLTFYHGDVYDDRDDKREASRKT